MIFYDSVQDVSSVCSMNTEKLKYLKFLNKTVKEKAKLPLLNNFKKL